MVDEAYRCVGLITVKDMDKAQAHPLANKDELGRLRVAAATGVGEDGHARAEALIEAEVDVIVVDTAHGHSAGVLAAVERIKRLSNAVQVIAGNVATPEGARGADRGGRGRGQDRHRAGQHLHHARRRRRRRAAVQRGAGDGGGVPRARRAGDRRWRHPHLAATSSRRSAPGRMRDDRQPARRHGRGAGRGVPLSGPLVQDPIAAWAASAPWRAARRTAISSRRSRTR